VELVVATSSWNTITLLEPFLRHMRQVGAVAAYVMDYGSTDGSAELIRSPEWRDFVHIVPFPGLDAPLTSDATMAMAKEQHPDAFCLFCDPDEFVCFGDESLQSVMEQERWGDHGVVHLARTNMTGDTADIAALQHGPFLNYLTLSIKRPHVRGTDEKWTGDLKSPWIFTAVPSKLLVRLSDCIAMGYGDHTATTTSGKKLRSSQAWLQHYPIRGWAEFEEKVRNIALHLAQDVDGPDLGPGHCWHWRRWAAQLEAGELRAEYERQFVGGDRLREYLADGTLVSSEHLAYAR
jgi:hypothetical protein